MCPKTVIVYLLVAFCMIKLYINCINDKKYVSHTAEPVPGEYVKNNNPNCKHYLSKGQVLNVQPLPHDMGKVITYIVLNDGPNYRKGNKLTKTMDQLCPS